LGRGSAQGNLVQSITGIFKFHQGVIPPTAGFFAEPGLLAAYRNSLNRQGKGPHRSMKVVEEYIRSEQELGRVDARVDARLAAGLLMSSSFFRAFIEEFFGQAIKPAWHGFCKAIDCNGCGRAILTSGSLSLGVGSRTSRFQQSDNHRTPGCN
jgi:hypothetical protein